MKLINRAFHDDDESYLSIPDDPMLIKRPVLEVDGRPAAVGFEVDVWAERLGAKG